MFPILWRALILNDQGLNVNNANNNNRFGNKARVNGGLKYKHFREMASI